MSIADNLTDEMKSLRQEKRELVKREKELKEHIKLEKDMLKWQKIMDVRTACLELVKDAELGMSMKLSKLEKFPDYFLYQHPTKTKLKTHDRSEDWVKMYLGEIPMDATGGVTGDEADLLNTARKSRLRAWKRLNKTVKKNTKTTTKTKTSGSGKGRISGTGIG